MGKLQTKFKEFFAKKKYFDLSPSNEEYLAIEDDYGIKDVSEVNPDIVQYVQEALETFQKKVKLWDDIKVVFIKTDDDLLGRFRSETSSSTPIIMLSDDNMVSGAEEYDVELWVVAETTIFHELGHAICELERDMFGYMYLEYGDEEEWVEDFAYDLHENGRIPDDLKLFIKKI